jgi:hypothetical protein
MQTETRQIQTLTPDIADRLRADILKTINDLDVNGIVNQLIEGVGSEPLFIHELAEYWLGEFEADPENDSHVELRGFTRAQIFAQVACLEKMHRILLTRGAANEKFEGMTPRWRAGMVYQAAHALFTSSSEVKEWSSGRLNKAEVYDHFEVLRKLVAAKAAKEQDETGALLIEALKRIDLKPRGDDDPDQIRRSHVLRVSSNMEEGLGWRIESRNSGARSQRLAPGNFASVLQLLRQDEVAASLT